VEGSQHQILLVDDNPTNLQVLYQTLTGRDSRLLVAKDGPQALSIAARVRPDLVLLDIMMPGMDGHEVCERLKSDPQTCDIAVIFLSALDDTKDKVKGFELGAVDYISKPFQAEEVIARVDTHLRIRRLERTLSRANTQLRELNERLEDKVLERTAQLLSGRDGVIYGLAKLAEARDNETGRHLDRMSRYSEILARRLTEAYPDLDEGWVVTVRTTAVLHDIGKIGIPDAVLHKPGRLDPEERRIMDRHPVIGGEALVEIQQRWGDDAFLITATEIAMSHHERWDGSGYPSGLKGEEIPLSARIVALADVYDALRSKRVYKDGWPHQRTREVILEGAGTHFDPQVVDAFRAVEQEFEVIAKRLAG
jgi:putative two-component system response regulator